MRFTRFTVLGVSTLMLAGCDDKGDVVVAPDRPRASVRFINAVPDTLVTDWRFIDQLELSPYENGFAFRAMTDYQAVAPGSRVFRIFPGTNDLNTQNALIAQTVDFAANQAYTLIHTGFSRSGQAQTDQLLVMQDAPPSVAATDIAFRAMHVAAGIGNIDIYVSQSGGATPLPATPTFTNVAYGAVTPYVTRVALPKSGPTAIAVTRTGFSRPAGSFSADRFAVGNQITAAGFGLAANDGRSLITGFQDSKTTGTAPISATPTGYARTTGSFVDDGFVAGTFITVSGFANPDNNGRAFVTAVTPTALTVAQTTGSTTLAATTTGFTRTTGSFLTDGFFVGMPVTASGFTNNALGNNNGAAIVTNVTATTLTVARTPALLVDTAVAGRSLSRTTRTVAEAEGAGRTIASDAVVTVNRTMTPQNTSGSGRTLIGELVFRATLTGTTTVIAEWTAPPGDPANAAANLQALGGATQGGSAFTGFLVSRSVPGSRAPQTAATANPPTPGFGVDTFIFAIDKHPR